MRFNECARPGESALEILSVPGQDLYSTAVMN